MPGDKSPWRVVGMERAIRGGFEREEERDGRIEREKNSGVKVERHKREKVKKR